MGDSLTAGTSGIADADGLSNASYTYQWVSNDGTSDSDIADAAASVYTLAAADVGKTIKVRVAFTDDAGNAESLTSAATSEVVAAATPNSPATGTPAITGTAQVGEVLTAATTGIADPDGLTNATFGYQWLADDAEISAATGSSYTLTSSEQGKTIKVRVTFTDDAGNAESLTSTATAAVATRPNSAATGAPTISGTAQVGETLTAATFGIRDDDGIAKAVFGYQWVAGESDISGATGSSYTLTSSEQGKAIKVRVTFTDDAGNAESLTSTATATVAAAPSPPSPLTASVHNTPTSHDGQSAFTFELRFSEEFGISYRTLRDHAFTVTGGTVKKAKRMEQGSNIQWRITVRPDSNSGGDHHPAGHHRLRCRGSHLHR